MRALPHTATMCIYLSGFAVSALQIEQQKTEERDKNIRPENHSSVTGSEIMGDDHLAHVTGGRHRARKFRAQ
jgi:hypothetical protein